MIFSTYLISYCIIFIPLKKRPIIHKSGISALACIKVHTKIIRLPLFITIDLLMMINIFSGDF